jgi:RNA polymerase sigma factor (sigma-70 family)
MNFEATEDRTLLVKCISGDRAAAEALVRRFSNLVFQAVQHTFLSKNIADSQQDIEDLHNTVFLHLFEKKCKKLRQFKGKNNCSPASWIRLIAVRTVLNHLRKKGYDAIRWQKDMTSVDDLPSLVGSQIDAAADLEAAEQQQILRRGIRMLPHRDRLLVKLHFDHGLSLSQVADMMNISMQNVYTLKHRTVQKLKSIVTSMTED